MSLKILDIQYDGVIKSSFLSALTDYDFAVDKLVPLISKLDYQRNPLRASFYSRLENDIIDGCIMPPLTIAYKMEVEKNASVSEKMLIENLDKAFVLDGIQRLNTLKRISERIDFPKTRPLYLNILLCNSMDRLLYRMITLNNGQKPMTARHQIEILASDVFDFESLPILTVTEKQVKSKKQTTPDENTMSKETVIKGYFAYISHSINIDNQKIIESKMDELIAEQIMDSNIVNRNIEYSDVIYYINTRLQNDVLKSWFIIPNNFIGFSAAMAVAYEVIKSIPEEKMELSISLFENAFSYIDVSKIKLGLARRRMVMYFFEHYTALSSLNENQLLNEISQEL